MSIADHHIATDPQRRENEAVERLLLMQGPADILRPYLEPALGWTGSWAWYAVRIPTECIIPDFDERRGLPGDVDVMGGPLDADPLVFAAAVESARAKLPRECDPRSIASMASIELFHSKKLRWPPTLERITAVEVKSASRDNQGKCHAHRSAAKKGLVQASGLIDLGFDAVALMWIAAGNPVHASGFGSWLEAGNAAALVRQFVFDRRIRVSDDQRFGQLLLRVGAVQHAPEWLAGSLGVDVLRVPPQLEIRPGSIQSARREALARLLLDAFHDSPFPPSLPAVVRYCRRCRKALLARGPPDRSCTRCGAACE